MCRKWRNQAINRNQHATAATLLAPQPGKLLQHPDAPTVERMYAPPSHVVPLTKDVPGGYSHIWELGQIGDATDQGSDRHGQEFSFSPPALCHLDDPHRQLPTHEHVYEDIPA